MLDIKELVKNYIEEISIKESGESIFVVPPIFNLYYDESIALRFDFQPDGRPIISDCHTTMDYLEFKGVNLKNYRDKIQKILDYFGLIEEENVFKMILPTDSEIYVQNAIGNFIQAIALISYINIM